MFWFTKDNQPSIQDGGESSEKFQGHKPHGIIKNMKQIIMRKKMTNFDSLLFPTPPSGTHTVHVHSITGLPTAFITTAIGHK